MIKKINKKKRILTFLFLMVSIMVIFQSGFITSSYAPKTQEINESIYEMNIIKYIRTDTPENYNFSFGIGNKIYGVIVTNESGIYGPSADFNAIVYTNFMVTQYLYNITEELKTKNAILKMKVDELNTTLASICGLSNIHVC